MNPVRISVHKRVSAGKNMKKISNGVNITKSTKIYIRRQKEEIRRSGVGPEEKFKLITKLYQELGIVKPIKKVKTK